VPPQPFKGAGLYVLYYNGPAELYHELAESKNKIPIYVGKAAAGSSRHGKLEAGLRTRKLYNRIKKHATSIELANNLDLADFQCRYRVMNDVWIVLGEQGLLQEYTPVWNVALSGFGNNPLGVGRKDQKKSSWDTVHEGRPTAGKLPNNKSLSEIVANVRAVIEARAAGMPVPESAIDEAPHELSDRDWEDEE
jgi:hypothetical protein